MDGTRYAMTLDGFSEAFHFRWVRLQNDGLKDFPDDFNLDQFWHEIT